MSVLIPSAAATSARDLLVLYSKKTAFTIDEYADCGSVYKRINSVLTDKNDANKNVGLDPVDVKFIVSAINVCSLRVPTEVANYKPIADLLEVLSSSLVKSEGQSADSPEAEELEAKL